MMWLLLYLTGAVVATAIAQRFLADDDVIGPDDRFEVAVTWLLAAIIGLTWFLLAPLAALAVSARQVQRWYDIHRLRRKA